MGGQTPAPLWRSRVCDRNVRVLHSGARYVGAITYVYKQAILMTVRMRVCEYKQTPILL